MRWPWRREDRLIKSKPMVSLKVPELETAKEILAEVFHARLGEVEEMIQSRLEERNWQGEKEIWSDQQEEGPWPATFCLGE
jgi:hypothetical protein